MTAIDLMLPQHLYKKTRNQAGEVTGVTYLHDRLINWFDRGKGVQRLCKSIYGNELAKITHWEENRLLSLEEQWLAIETGEEDDDSEVQYHQDCDAIVREADTRRAAAKAQMTERGSAIERLVSQCANHVEKHTPAPRASHAAEYLIAFVVIGVITYTLL